jgi:hypothetical protein
LAALSRAATDEQQMRTFGKTDEAVIYLDRQTSHGLYYDRPEAGLLFTLSNAHIAL